MDKNCHFEIRKVTVNALSKILIFFSICYKGKFLFTSVKILCH